MGLLDDAASVLSGHTSHRGTTTGRHHRSSTKRRSGQHKTRSSARSPSRSRSPARRGLAASIFGGAADDDDDDDVHRHRHGAARSSFFGQPSASRSGFFNFGGRSSSSYYKRSPRPNFLTRALRKLRRLLRDLLYYARRHPAKVLTLVVLPLLTGGALTALLARFGLRLPAGVERWLGRAHGSSPAGMVGEAVRGALGGGGGARGRGGGGAVWERERRSITVEGKGGGWGHSLMGMAKSFF